MQHAKNQLKIKRKFLLYINLLVTRSEIAFSAAVQLKNHLKQRVNHCKMS